MATVVLINGITTSHYIRYLFIYTLMSFVLYDHQAVCHSCTDYVPLDVSFIQRALFADIVLYGKDITPTTTNCAQTTNQTCDRGNITLEVSLMQKHGITVPQIIFLCLFLLKHIRTYIHFLARIKLSPLHVHDMLIRLPLCDTFEGVA